MNERGVAAEELASRYLVSQGLKLVARNWHCRFGEIDIIAQDGSELVFIEVRKRSGNRFGDAASSITAAKQAKLFAAAQLYLSTLGRVPPCRFDAVLLDGQSGPRWLKNIIQG